MPEPVKAVLTPLTDENGRNLSASDQDARRVAVHFNPETLQMTLTNRVEKGRGAQAAQHVTDATAELSMELVFDTTLTGTDVREHTQPIARMMDPVLNRGARQARDRNKKIPAIVVFEWGTVKFTGFISSYKETLDFFAPEGIPLRSSVTLTLSQQERRFEEGEVSAANREAVQERTQATLMDVDPEESLTHSAAKAGDPRAAKDLARQNNVDSLRRPGIGTLAFGAEVSLKTGFSASASGPIGLDFGMGGKAKAGFSGGFRADVGSGRSLRDLIRFEEE
uniref:Contractile injection system tube protein N-terminal domain-containing protein n=1 Tax=Desulfacinum infernum TaxID=35837 RepID=A0A832EKS8_9BACT